MKKYKDHELCEAVITWGDEYPGIVDVHYLGRLYEIVCKDKPLSVGQRSYLVKFIAQHDIDVENFI